MLQESNSEISALLALQKIRQILPLTFARSRFCQVSFAVQMRRMPVKRAYSCGTLRACLCPAARCQRTARVSFVKFPTVEMAIGVYSGESKQTDGLLAWSAAKARADELLPRDDLAYLPSVLKILL